MAQKILVPLKKRDRVERLIPYLEEIAKPGMRVVFLLPYAAESWAYLGDHWITTESASKAMSKGRKITERYSWELQMGLAEQKISSLRKVLEPKEIEVAVDLYTASLRKVLKDHCAGGDVHLIMMKAGSDHPIVRLLNWIFHGFDLFKRPKFAPVLLLDPSEVV
jgi:hypothetical protein